jgi:hypothetical protein
MNNSSVLWTCLFCCLAASSSATFHDIEIQEVFTGLNGDSSIQFIELRTLSPFQTQLAGRSIIARNADGLVPTTVFTFPGNYGNSQADDRILIATAGFEALAGITPDFTFAGGLSLDSGQIELFPGGTIDVDALSYGNYTGPQIPRASDIAPAIPDTNTQSLQLINLGEGQFGNDSINYQLPENAPTNIAGQTGNVQPAAPMPTVLLEINGTHPPEDFVLTTGLIDLTLDMDPDGETNPLDWYFAFIVGPDVSWIISGGISSIPAPLMTSSPFLLNDLPAAELQSVGRVDHHVRFPAD